MKNIHTVTGAFGNSGAYIAERLLKSGLKVETLTNSSKRPSPLRSKIKAHPLDFEDTVGLAKCLKNTAVLYNNYWVRYDADNFSHRRAVENSRRLFAAAKRAGVGRVVQVSISNPDLNSPYEYFSGKAKVEQALKESGLKFSVLRPPLLFGPEDILINNIAWMLRRFPVFGLFGTGDYRMQPIFVEDLADLAVAEGKRKGKRVIHAIGPETFTYREMVTMLAAALNSNPWIVAMPPALGWAAGKLMGWVMRDNIITWEEIKAMMEDALYVDAKPAGSTRLSDWARENRHILGLSYANELGRRRDRTAAYGLSARATPSALKA